MERQLKRAPFTPMRRGRNSKREYLRKERVRVYVCVRGNQVYKIKVLAPQSVRVQMEGDRVCSKGEDEESGLKKEERN